MSTPEYRAERKLLIKRRKKRGLGHFCAEFMHWACYGRRRTRREGLLPCTCNCHQSGEAPPPPAVTSEAERVRRFQAKLAAAVAR